LVCGAKKTTTNQKGENMIETSGSITELSNALALFHSKCPKVLKGSNNPYFKSRYADLADILETVTPILSENGLSVIQVPCEDDQLVTMLVHKSGEFIRSKSRMRPVATVIRRDQQGNDVFEVTPQALGSAITYQRRYAVAALLSLCIDEDDDGNAASGRSVSSKRSEQPKEAKVEPLSAERIAAIPKRIEEADLSKLPAMEASLANFGASDQISKAQWSEFTYMLLMRWISICPISGIAEPTKKIAYYRSRNVITAAQQDNLLQAIECATNEASKE
jgi:hypothetical protein